MKILIVEDEPSLREIMYRALVQEHYVVETAATYADADAKVAGYSYDCILLDIMLPDGNGLRLLEHIKELRKRENVIIISARNSLEDKVLGLEQGADDYLPKPFHTAELLARIRSVLRRGRSGGDLSLSLGNVSLWPEGRRVEVEGRELALLKKEFDILLYFMQRPNHLVDKAVLAEAVWGDHADDADNFHFVYAQMKNLAARLDNMTMRGSDPSHVATMREALKTAQRDIIMAVRRMGIETDFAGGHTVGWREVQSRLNEHDAAVEFMRLTGGEDKKADPCLLYTSPSPRDRQKSRMPSSA